MATATKPTLDEVLELASKLTTADQAQLIARIAPVVADALVDEPASPPTTTTRLKELTAQLLADPNSALSRVLQIRSPDSPEVTDEDIDRWREEAILKRYGT